MANVPVLGQDAASNNPLLVLAQAMSRLEQPLKEIARNTAPDATAVIPHHYCLAQAEDKGGHGKVWGTFCLACSDSAGQYIYPCMLTPDEPIKPPMFFTIGDVYELDKQGRMLKYQPPGASS